MSWFSLDMIFASVRGQEVEVEFDGKVIWSRAWIFWGFCCRVEEARWFIVRFGLLGGIVGLLMCVDELGVGMEVAGIEGYIGGRFGWWWLKGLVVGVWLRSYFRGWTSYFWEWSIWNEKFWCLWGLVWLVSEYDPSYQPSDYSIPLSLRIDFDVLKLNFQRSLIKQINHLKEMNVYMSASDLSRLFARDGNMPRRSMPWLCELSQLDHHNWLPALCYPKFERPLPLLKKVQL